jgi:hypothetical protein
MGVIDENNRQGGVGCQPPKLSLNLIAVAVVVQFMNYGSKLLQNLLGCGTVGTITDTPKDYTMFSIFVCNKRSHIILWEPRQDISRCW